MRLLLNGVNCRTGAGGHPARRSVHSVTEREAVSAVVAQHEAPTLRRQLGTVHKVD